MALLESMNPLGLALGLACFLMFMATGENMAMSFAIGIAVFIIYSGVTANRKTGKKHVPHKRGGGKSRTNK